MNTANRKIIVVVDPVSKELEPAGIIYPEDHVMPKDAVKIMKRYIDTFFNTEDEVLKIFTVSSDVVSFTYGYGRLKRCPVEIHYHSELLDIESIFKHFNEVFRYSDKLLGDE